MDLLLKNVWIGKNSPSANDSEPSRRKCDSVEEITISPMIVTPLEALKSRNFPSPLLFRTWPHNKNFVCADETHIDVLNVGEPLARSRQNSANGCAPAPAKSIKFDVIDVFAAVVTCGGLCPGLKNVLREMTTTLLRTNSVKCVYSIPYGYKGFFSHEWRRLDFATVRDIHNSGGTILGTSRGGFDLERLRPRRARARLSDGPHCRRRARDRTLVRHGVCVSTIGKCDGLTRGTLATTCSVKTLCAFAHILALR